MPTREDFLREKTFKGETEDVARRVFYTITDDDGQYQEHRARKLLSSLLELLSAKGVISGDELDGLLLESIN